MLEVMPRKLFLFLGFGLIFGLWPRDVWADANLCTVTVSPSSVTMSSEGSLSFNLTNTSEGAIGGVLLRSSNDNVMSVSGGSGWHVASLGSDYISFDNGNLAPTETVQLTVNVSAGGSVDSVSWSVQVSDTGNGGLGNCDGDLGISVVAPVANPQLSNVSLAIGSSSTTISWGTDLESNSKIDFGASSGYGSNVADGSFSNNHSLTLTDLSPTTEYHFKITSVTSEGGSASTEDLSFTTGAVNSVVKTTTVTNVVTNTTTVTTVKEIKDTTPPSVLLIDLDKKVYTKPPEISGTISDAYGVLEVEYSLDGGKNWAKVAMDGERGDKKSKFTFEPDVSADGTYDVMVRGLDISGNKSAGKEISFVLDQLDPAIGPGMYQMGLLPIYPDGGGVLHIPTNLDVLVMLPEIGGSDTMVLTIGDKKYALKKESGSGLWKGVFRLENKEKRTVSAEAVDGAGNVTKRDLVKVEGESMGVAVDESGQGIKDVTITVYVYDQDKKDFKEWDGVSRGITNPVKTDEGGNFSFYLPKGRYFIKLENKDWGVVRTKIFESNGFELINPKLVLGNWLHNWWWKALSGLDVWPEINIEMKRPSLSVNNSLSSLFPINDLLRDSTKVSGEEKRYLIGNSSLPMPVIGKNITYVGFFEGLSRVKSFLGKSGIESAYYADPLGKLMKSLPLWTLPTIVRVDSTGVIKEMVWGNEIFNYLTQNGK